MYKQNKSYRKIFATAVTATLVASAVVTFATTQHKVPLKFPDMKDLADKGKVYQQ